MRRTLGVALVLCICLMASTALAGRLLGDIRLDGKPVAEGLRIRLAAAPAKPGAAPAVVDSTVTDKFGSYKLMAKDEGKYLLTLVFEKQPVSLEVYAYKEPTRYDLVLEKKDGKLSLSRK
ncbi:MAG: hypothetical protein ACYDIE_00205 [Candidatus Krumholzibacteriia bacterium]